MKAAAKYAKKTVETLPKEDAFGKPWIYRGDRVHVARGPLEGQEVEVLEIVNGKARFPIRMFGGVVAAEAPLEWPRKAAE